MIAHTFRSLLTPKTTMINIMNISNAIMHQNVINAMDKNDKNNTDNSNSNNNKDKNNSETNSPKSDKISSSTFNSIISLARKVAYSTTVTSSSPVSLSPTNSQTNSNDGNNDSNNNSNNSSAGNSNNNSNHGSDNNKIEWKDSEKILLSLIMTISYLCCSSNFNYSNQVSGKEIKNTNLNDISSINNFSNINNSYNSNNINSNNYNNNNEIKNTLGSEGIIEMILEFTDSRESKEKDNIFTVKSYQWSSLALCEMIDLCEEENDIDTYINSNNSNNDENKSNINNAINDNKKYGNKRPKNILKNLNLSILCFCHKSGDIFINSLLYILNSSSISNDNDAIIYNMLSIIVSMCDDKVGKHKIISADNSSRIILFLIQKYANLTGMCIQEKF